MSTYVLKSGEVYIECDMEYSKDKDVLCRIEGAPAGCLEEVIRRSGLEGFLSLQGEILRISTAVFSKGVTPGEIIKMLATALRFC